MICCQRRGTARPVEVFFFSSRRRHTRSLCDWSSDVCSSDLEELGGLAREAFGGLFVVDSPEQRRGGIRDSYELALDDWMRTADFDPEDEWPRRWAEQYVRVANEEIRDWLRERKIGVFPAVNWAERGVFGDGNSVPRFHLAWGTGKRLVDATWQAIEEHPRRRALELRFHHRITKLVEGGCEGVDEANGDA